MHQSRGTLTAYVGPMCSGKSHRMVGEFAPLVHAGVRYFLFQAGRHTRDGKAVKTRNGGAVEAEPIGSLRDILTRTEGAADIYRIGIEEFHFFDAADFSVIETLRERGINVVVSGCDLDYRRELFPMFAELLRHGPDSVVHLRAVCAVCKRPDSAIYSQLLVNGKASLGEGLSSQLPDVAGMEYSYRPVCAGCYAETLKA